MKAALSEPIGLVGRCSVASTIAGRSYLCRLPSQRKTNRVQALGQRRREPTARGYGACMQAAVHTRYGPPEVVRLVELPTPKPKSNELLVKVYATTVNRTDCGFRGAKPFFVRGFTGLTRPRVMVLGNEFAGQVEAVGPGVKTFAVGDRVFGYDDTAFGAHAQYLTIREDASLARIPANLSYAQAAPATEGSHYALTMMRKARIRSGQRVLVNGATGQSAPRSSSCRRAVGCLSPRSATPRS